MYIYYLLSMTYKKGCNIYLFDLIFFIKLTVFVSFMNRSKMLIMFMDDWGESEKYPSNGLYLSSFFSFWLLFPTVSHAITSGCFLDILCRYYISCRFVAHDLLSCLIMILGFTKLCYLVYALLRFRYLL